MKASGDAAPRPIENRRGAGPGTKGGTSLRQPKAAAADRRHLPPVDSS